MKNKLTSIGIVALAMVFLSACGSKPVAVPATPTPTPKMVEIPVSERPTIGLAPREDGHMLFLKISQLPSSISSIEYELIYSAKDGGLEIEKGLGDTIKDTTGTIERKLLLGTESCTNGCKYKYDEGVSGGTLSLKFITKTGQMSTYESSFVLKSSNDLRKEKALKLTTENFEVPLPAKITGNDFYTLIKQYKGGYSVFSSGTSTLTGEYPRQ